MKNQAPSPFSSSSRGDNAPTFGTPSYLKRGKGELIFPIVFIVSFFFCSALPSFGADKEGFPVKKQPELQQIKPKKPVRIKLKRTAKDDYSWELTGDDADEIIQTDRRLRKVLGTK
ncbi:MAG: hypothetical protein WA610_07530 [Thermodesulfovibrionales bacterium]